MDYLLMKLEKEKLYTTIFETNLSVFCFTK